jgi:hypothetical protein
MSPADFWPAAYVVTSPVRTSATSMLTPKAPTSAACQRVQAAGTCRRAVKRNSKNSSMNTSEGPVLKSATLNCTGSMNA